MVDTVAAEPGSVTPNDNLTETIYNFCTSWFGEAAGTWRGVTTVDIECKNKQEADMTDEVDIVNYVATVFSR